MSGSPVTVAICTHDRPDMLERLVAGLLPALRDCGVALLVIDSASVEPVAPRIAALDADVCVVRLEVPGIALARNAALLACDTPWIAFLDDDEVPVAGWLDAVLALIARLPADCAGCGGDVVPDWERRDAPRIGRRWLTYLSMIEQAGEFDQSERPWFGIGHAVMRMAAMRSVGGFDPRLGRDGATLLSGEESHLIALLIARGWRIWHSDRLRVLHHVPPERLERAWVRDRAYWEGVSTLRRFRLEGRNGLRRYVAKAWVKAVMLRGAAPLGRRFDCDLRRGFVEGVLAEHGGGAIAA
ncbi:glycosyltransferase [Sphingomonas sp. GM_Shp_2]|uniref:glycosyltransferase family 2 protein n=1 Tax=Sphingomonas sp. GM_Shp_2 TaxID=2937380 RepID=UPI0022699CA7|nr:glycosyltransferase [Sphingomonas sp. GM_Shp_2]